MINQDPEFVHALPLLIIFGFILFMTLGPLIAQIFFTSIINFLAYLINPVKYRHSKFIDRKKLDEEK